MTLDPSHPQECDGVSLWGPTLGQRWTRKNKFRSALAGAVHGNLMGSPHSKLEVQMGNHHKSSMIGGFNGHQQAIFDYRRVCPSGKPLKGLMRTEPGHAGGSTLPLWAAAGRERWRRCRGWGKLLVSWCFLHAFLMVSPRFYQGFHSKSRWLLATLKVLH